MGTNKRYPSERPHWHPAQIAEPVEWELRNGWPPDPIGVVRMLSFQRGNQVDVYYRAVTWAPDSASRQLIGYFPSLELAAAAVWEQRHGRSLRNSPYA